MNAILHRIEIRKPPAELFDAIASQTGLAAWWTPMVEAEAKVGSTAKFRFGDGKHGPDMKVTELVPEKQITWECVSAPWPGMKISFEIQENEKGSVLLFTHSGWEETSEFFMHCNSKWGFFLGVSLKRYLETGTGQPNPEDPDF